MTEHNAGEIPYDPNPWSLTSREEAMLNLVAEGKTHAEIANELSIAAKTVGNTLSQLRLRLEKDGVIKNLPDSAGLAQMYKYTY